MVRRPGRKAPPSPLPQRDGVDAVRVRLPGVPGGGPGSASWDTVGAYLAARYGPAVGAGRVEAMVAQGRFVTVHGAVTGDTPYEAGLWIWFHRDRPAERPVPFPVRVIHQDERIVVADKPHFLATTPRGSHVAETALARLRHSLDLPQLTPAHRLDLLTAGLVLFVVDPRLRGAYQNLFRDRLVRKEYEAVAPYDPGMPLPLTVRSRIVKERGQLAAQEVPGPVNAVTRVELLDRRGGLGRYLLLPETGRTHQLRVHMNALGLPLLNDPVYPRVLPGALEVQDLPSEGELLEAPVEAGGPGPQGVGGPGGRFTAPLQLLARVLEFTDPVSGGPMRFESTRTLEAWSDDAAARG
ncbi:pseudouridine synthase [Actinacidiphila yeochonensis]|uniref:pseudouridine synthase n=1 Tax=Actinacidiphila yeochonensis TaxID=89050 RepID=UPI000D1B7C08|nr:pseudouridine synthase [Actinacidiphila yeochonensis]